MKTKAERTPQESNEKVLGNLPEMQTAEVGFPQELLTASFSVPGMGPDGLPQTGLGPAKWPFLILPSLTTCCLS